MNSAVLFPELPIIRSPEIDLLGMFHLLLSLSLIFGLESIRLGEGGEK